MSFEGADRQSKTVGAGGRSMSVASLKKQLKALGLPQTGEKPALENRLKLHALGEKHQIEGVNPVLLKAGPLKKALATRGLPCDLSIEDRDALLGRLLGASAHIAVPKRSKKGQQRGQKHDPEGKNEFPLKHMQNLVSICYLLCFSRVRYP